MAVLGHGRDLDHRAAQVAGQQLEPPSALKARPGARRSSPLARGSSPGSAARRPLRRGAELVQAAFGHRRHVGMHQAG
jgi:hypothetical protein